MLKFLVATLVLAATATNVMEFLETKPELSFFVSLIEDSYLQDLDRTVVTVFAPTNEAFAKLPPGLIGGLQGMGRSDDLTRFLDIHVVPGEVYSKDLKADQNITTRDGNIIEVTKSAAGVVHIIDNAGSNGVVHAKVISADNAASNGVVHIIDAVLITKSILERNINQFASTIPDLSTFVAALTAGKLTKNTYPSPIRGTVFAPTNEAFAKIPALLKHLLEPANSKELHAVLTYHVIQSAILYSYNLKANQTVPTADYGSVEITKTAQNQIYVNNNSHVTVADIHTNNGALHLIDTVLIPPALAARARSFDLH